MFSKDAFPVFKLEPPIIPDEIEDAPSPRPEFFSREYQFTTSAEMKEDTQWMADTGVKNGELQLEEAQESVRVTERHEEAQLSGENSPTAQQEEHDQKNWQSQLDDQDIAAELESVSLTDAGLEQDAPVIQHNTSAISLTVEPLEGATDEIIRSSYSVEGAEVLTPPPEDDDEVIEVALFTVTDFGNSKEEEEIEDAESARPHHIDYQREAQERNLKLQISPHHTEKGRMFGVRHAPGQWAGTNRGGVLGTVTGIKHRRSLGEYELGKTIQRIEEKILKGM
jgi:hypothetical protein